MEDTETIRLSNRVRILFDLKSIIKQVYHEAVNGELSAENVTYITRCLIKRIDESLLFGLSQPQSGYWAILQRILHSNDLKRINHESVLNRGRLWIALSLLDDTLSSYVNCFVEEKRVARVYEEWSIIRHNDSCHSFLSLLSGLATVAFHYNVPEGGTLPIECKLSAKFSSPRNSLHDSGVMLDRSDDYLNGNVPEPVVMRRKGKPTPRHVSFHEDSVAKSPSQRKLKWDAETSRYSWAGEELDEFNLGSFKATVLHESPRPISLNRCQKKGRRLSTRKFRCDNQMLASFASQLSAEIARHRHNASIYELELPEKLIKHLGVENERKWAYKLWGGKVIVITPVRLLILHKDLTTTRLNFDQMEQVVVLPHGHEVQILTRKLTHSLTCGSKALSHEIITRLAYQLHIANYHSVHYRVLYPGDLHHLIQELVKRKILTWDEQIGYLGVVRQQNTLPPVLTVEKSGCVMFLTNHSPSWQPATIVLRGGFLNVYGENRSSLACINLMSSCVGCERSNFPDRPHTFTLTIKQSNDADESLYDQLLKGSTKWTHGQPVGQVVSQWVNRAFGSPSSTKTTAIHIAAADEYLMSDWLQALLTTFCHVADVGIEGSDVTQVKLVVTDSMMVLLSQEPFTVFGSACCRDISAFRIGPHSHDSYCIIEFECQEAGSATSDWVLHFGARAELEQLRVVLEKQWEGDGFPIYVEAVAHCERVQDCLNREWFA